MKYETRTVAQVVHLAFGSKNTRLISKFEKSLREHFPYRKIVRSYEVSTKFPGVTIHDWLVLDAYLFKNPWLKISLKSGSGPVRTKELILLSSVPRSGNTLMQKVINDIWNVPSTSAHSFDDIDFTRTPKTLLLQVHQPFDRSMQKYYGSFKFKVINIYRHPYDVLLSMLNFSHLDRQVIYWRDGAVTKSDEYLARIAPTDKAFIKWACSRSMQSVMNISASWEGKPESFTVRYEEIVEDLPVVVVRLAKFLGRNNNASRDYINSLHRKKLPGIASHHKWRGVVGGFYDFLPKDTLQALNKVYSKQLIANDYIVDMKRAPAAQVARQNWLDTAAPQKPPPVLVSPWAMSRLEELGIQTTKLDDLHYWSQHLEKDPVTILKRHAERLQKEIDRLDKAATLSLSGVSFPRRIKRAFLGLTTDWFGYVKSKRG